MLRFRNTLNLLSRNYSTAASQKLNRNEWEPVIGLEVHAQIQSKTKLFSSTSANFGAPVNTLVSLFDASIPGTLPVINSRCVEIAVATSLALSCKLNMRSTFDRKHYFYADLPAGYQITQQRKAIAEYGKLRFPVIIPSSSAKPYYKECGIRQLQLEQDSGKSLHDGVQNKSLIDLNRAGIALMEIVFLPDLSSGEEAASLVKELILILESLDACNCRMEEGSLRVDANISVNKPGDGLGTRTEVKNLSSLRSLVNAIEYEITRQIGVLETGGKIVNETRSFDAERKITLPMRDKEVQQDYRFMPEPNLPPLNLYESENESQDSTKNVHHNGFNISAIKRKEIHLPDETRQELVSTYKLRIEAANAILNIPKMLPYYKKVMSILSPEYGVRAANILLTEVMALAYSNDLEFENISIEPKNIADLTDLMERGAIDMVTVKNILQLFYKGDNRTTLEIVEKEGWMKVRDDTFILECCKKAIEANPKIAKEWRETKKPKYLNKLIAYTRKNTTDILDMKKVTEVLQKLLNEKC